jgi:hypothetical protein
MAGHYKTVLLRAGPKSKGKLVKGRTAPIALLSFFQNSQNITTLFPLC